MAPALFILAAMVGLTLLLGWGLHVGGGAQAAGNAPGPSPLIGHQAPPLSGPTLSGGTANLSSLRGSVVLVNVWASWCTPCRQELPLLSDVAHVYRPDGLRVMTINTRDGPVPAREFLRQIHARGLTTISDPDGARAVTWGVRGIPETFLVDRDGIVRARRVGAVTPAWLRQQLGRWLLS
jgi:cytochrome c biogenesis protein CcmG/thiol:disulfide interchange protein DsbE